MTKILNTLMSFFKGLFSNTQCSTQLKLNLKVFIEGAYVDGTNEMHTKISNILPLNQPYPSSGPFYNLNSCALQDSKAVDWVLVKLRTVQNDPSSTVLTLPGLLLNDGTIKFCEDNLCNETLGLNLSVPYGVTVQHRNHLGIESHVQVSFVGDTLSHDFTLQDSLIGEFNGSPAGNGSKASNDGKFVLIGGNPDQGGTAYADINAGDDSIYTQQKGESGYKEGDMNLDGIVNSADQAFWQSNTGNVSLIAF